MSNTSYDGDPQYRVGPAQAKLPRIVEAYPKKLLEVWERAIVYIDRTIPQRLIDASLTGLLQAIESAADPYRTPVSFDVKSEDDVRLHLRQRGIQLYVPDKQPELTPGTPSKLSMYCPAISAPVKDLDVATQTEAIIADSEARQFLSLRDGPFGLMVDCLMLTTLLSELYSFTLPEESPHNAPPWALLLTSYDFEGGADDFLHGARTDNTIAASTARILSHGNSTEQEKMDAMQHLLRHEVGHALGLPNRSRIGVVDDIGPHCPPESICTMRQSPLGTDQLFEQALEQRLQSAHFCGDCVRELFQKYST